MLNAPSLRFTCLILLYEGYPGMLFYERYVCLANVLLILYKVIKHWLPFCLHRFLLFDWLNLLR